jgi:hypothetical protein
MGSLNAWDLAHNGNARNPKAQKIIPDGAPDIPALAGRSEAYSKVIPLQ